jgi:hypothetical protein
VPSGKDALVVSATVRREIEAGEARVELVSSLVLVRGWKYWL